MNLIELAKEYTCSDQQSVPDWMIGTFRRRCISYADGSSDKDTRVFWLQSRGLTIDLRLPVQADQVMFNLSETGWSSDMIAQQAEYEAWYAHTLWQNNQLSWVAGENFQAHNKWPEAAELIRVGNCMTEFAPSRSYVEDWRLQNQEQSRYLIGLELCKETNLRTGHTIPRKGSLIVNGDWAGLVVGRASPLAHYCDIDAHSTLSGITQKLAGDKLSAVFDFSTVIARTDASNRYCIEHSLYATEVGKVLDLDNFTLTTDGMLQQTLVTQGSEIQRTWRIDCLENNFCYTLATPVDNSTARQWRAQENSTLDRYTNIIY